MNVYLLPHHRLDPRYRFTLEREVSEKQPASEELIEPAGGFVRRAWMRLRNFVRRMRTDYDQTVHGREQIRLSKLLLLMDRDPDLTLVIPAGMTREWALEAIRGVIRAGLMNHRWPTIRNVTTALVMMLILFGATPTHFAALVFYPLIGLYAWRRYWEDRLIRRILQRLLDQRLMHSNAERFREEIHLTRLEEEFGRIASPEAAYRAAVAYLDGLDDKVEGKSTPEHALLFNYYHDIGRLDPYESYMDRIRKKLIESAKLLWHTIRGLARLGWRWTFGRTLISGVAVPNWTFMVAALLLVNMTLWWSVRQVARRLSADAPPAAISTPPAGDDTDSTQ